MSVRSVNAREAGVTRPGNIPCVGAGGTPSAGYAQSGVRLGDTVQIVFPGSPPYNLSQTICASRTQCWCAATITDLNTSNFTWTVSTVPSEFPEFPNTTGRDAPDQLFTDGQSMVWIAVQVNQSAEFTSFYTSPNFTRTNTSYDNPISGSSLRLASPGGLGLLGWGIMSLAVLGLAMGA